jgi:hypothetical protein
VIGLVRFLYLLALVVWLGEIIFFSFVVAPTVFGVLEVERAGQVTSAIFPRYYAIGMGAGGLAVACAVVLARHAATPGWWWAAGATLGLGLAATLWAGLVVRPRTEQLRAAARAAAVAPSDDPAFGAAHRLAVVLNSVALLSGLAGLGLSAAALRQ